MTAATVTGAEKYVYAIHQFVASSDFFVGLNRESIERVARRMRTVHYDENELICREGDIGNTMYIVVAGEVTILKDMGWGFRELKRMGSGESFGEMALISSERRTATVKALTKTCALGAACPLGIQRNNPTITKPAIDPPNRCAICFIYR